MSPPLVGLLGIIVLVLLFLLEMPISFTMALVGFVGFSLLTSFGGGFSILARDVYDAMSNFNMTAITTFVAMGCYAFATGITTRLFDTCYKWVGHLRGGLAMAAVFACAFFAAICGSSVATSATIGKVAVPEMRNRGYNSELVAGCIAAGGTLGILIPPSNMMIVYGVITQQSIGKLFIAGFVPGIILTLLFSLVVFIICRRNPNAGPAGTAKYTWGEKFKAILGLAEVVVLFGLVIGGLFGGLFTPTQAGGIGAAGALLIGLVRRELTWKKFYAASKEALITSCMIIFIIAGATIFGHFIAVTTLPTAFAGMVKTLALSPLVTMILIVIVYFIGGCFVDMLPLVLLTLPIFYPVIIAQGFNPIWFCIVIILVTQFGLLTPPVGVNAYVVHGLMREISLGRVFKGIYPFLMAIFVMIVLLFLFPGLATFVSTIATY